MDVDTFVADMHEFFLEAAHPKMGEVVTVQWLHRVFARKLHRWTRHFPELVNACLEHSQKIGEALAKAANEGHATSRRDLPEFNAQDALNYTVNTVSEGAKVPIARYPAPAGWPHDSLFEDVRALERRRAM